MSTLRRLRGVLIAIVALAMSAGIAFGAQPPSAASGGLANAGSHAGKTVPVQADENQSAGDEASDEGDEAGDAADASSDGAGDNCATDPTALTAEELAAMSHGSIVCWAAHQTEWPAWFANHGAFVRCWAHQGKADAASCTEAPTSDPAATSSHGNGKGHGRDK